MAVRTRAHVFAMVNSLVLERTCRRSTGRCAGGRRWRVSAQAGDAAPNWWNGL